METPSPGHSYAGYRRRCLRKRSKCRILLATLIGAGAPFVVPHRPVRRGGDRAGDPQP